MKRSIYSEYCDFILGVSNRKGKIMTRGQATKQLSEKQIAELKVKAEQKRKATFKRMFEARVTKACKAIDLVGNCSGAGYSYTKDEASQGITELANHVKKAAERFNKQAKVEAVGFKLSQPDQGS